MSNLIKQTDRSLRAILAPQVTEKATMIADKNNSIISLPIFLKKSFYLDIKRHHVLEPANMNGMII